MKWAIFDFGDNTFDIGQTSWIQGEDSETFDNEFCFFTNEVIVKWPKDFNAAKKKMLKNLDVDITKTESERYLAKIVKFGGERLATANDTKWQIDACNLYISCLFIINTVVHKY